MSQRLLNRRTSLEIRSYFHQPVPVQSSEDSHRLHPDITETPAELAGFHYLIITGRCDGPWLLSDKGELGPVCGQPRPILKHRPSFDELEVVHLGDTAPLPATSVFTDTWHDEDSI